MPIDPPQSEAEVRFSSAFTRKVKKLRKKYPHVLSDLQEVIQELQAGDFPGDRVPGLDYAIYKARVKNTDAKKGKRGGYRVLYYFVKDDLRLLITIYAKSDQPDIALSQIRLLVQEAADELTDAQDDDNDNDDRDAQ